YKIAGLGALLSEVMRRLCVVRSEGVPPACAQNRVTCKKANPYNRLRGPACCRESANPFSCGCVSIGLRVGNNLSLRAKQSHLGL
ncbi:MAG TPA: hypothetical protein VK463_19320, partial [Desulfomonilaceae bacterium]|nr:hypothetical protein [Desulfomonilaceae bacterium]